MLIKIADIECPTELEVSSDDNFISQLAESIKAKGMLHPITVRRKSKDKFSLVAGLKRLRACLKLEFVNIECKLWEKGDTVDALLELHIHENLIRDNLDWWEVVSLEKQLHELRVKQHGHADASSFGRGHIKADAKQEGWSLRDTAKELNISYGLLSQDITLAEAVLGNPALRKIKDKTTALKMARRELQRLEKEQESTIPSQITENEIYLGNALHILCAFPPNIFDACITDPPWLKFEMDKSLTRDEDTPLVFKELYRTMKYDSILYAFVGTDDFIFYRSELPKMGFSVQSYPALWWKPNVVTHGRKAWEHTRDIEQIIVAAKGNPVLTDSGNVSSVIKCTAIPGQFLKHPNEKPGDVIRKLVHLSSYERGLIIDPFAGSGVVPQICKEMNRRYIAIEKEKKYYEVMQERLK